ncbi:MAG TPA: CBS domain-containing protein [Mycobacteriales bacterium]|nr:CBS domain-containing protein [Mycobacteriales bacterium]
MSIEDLLAARDEHTLSELMNPNPAVVGPGTDQEAGAFRAVEHDQIALPVVEGQGRFVGLVPPRRILSVLRAEHESDLARIGGYLHDAAQARTASTEPMLRRLAHRLPWLLLGLLGAIASAGLVGSFEGRLQETVALAFFLPGVVYLADAVGTQTEAVIIRGLSVGIDVRAIIWREAATSLLIGAALAALFLPSRCSTATWPSRPPPAWLCSRPARLPVSWR